MKVSVIVPVRNCENTIEGTLQSIFAQSHKDIEILVIDGASTDGTMSIVNKYADRVAVRVSEPDQGTSDAINKGVGRASGHICTMLNADDHFADADVVARAVIEFVKNPSLDFLFSAVKIIDPTGLVADRTYHSDPTQLSRWVSLHFPGAFYKISSIEEPMMRLDYKIANDYEFVCRHVLRLKRKIAVIPDVGVVMRLGGMSGDPKRDIRHSWEKFKIRRQYFGLWPALSIFAVALPVSVLRRLHFRPLQWSRLMGKFLESLHRHQFFSLSGGIVFSNVVSLLTMPLFTRIYPVEAFGYFAVFWSLATVLSLFTTLRLEIALPLIEDESERKNLAVAAWQTSLAIVFLFLLVWYFTGVSLIFNAIPSGQGFGASIAVAALLNSVIQIQNQISIKLGRLNAISIRHILEKIVVVAASIAFMSFENYGLIAAQIAGISLAALILIFANRSMAALNPVASFGSGLSMLRKYRDFPLKNGPATAFQLLSAQLPPLLFGMIFPAQLLGFYNLAQRLVDAPNVIVGSAISVVFYRRMLNARRKDMRRIFLRTIRTLALVLLPCGVITGFFARPLFHIFGTQWEPAHVFLLLLLPLALSRMLFVAAQSLLVVLRKLERDMAIAALIFVSNVTGLAAGYLFFGTLEGCVGGASVLTTLAYIAGLILIYRSSDFETAADKV